MGLVVRPSEWATLGREVGLFDDVQDGTHPLEFGDLSVVR